MRSDHVWAIGTFKLPDGGLFTHVIMLPRLMEGSEIVTRLKREASSAYGVCEPVQYWLTVGPKKPFQFKSNALPYIEEHPQGRFLVYGVRKIHEQFFNPPASPQPERVQ